MQLVHFSFCVTCAAAEAAEALRLIAVVIKSGHQAMASNARSVDRTYINISIGPPHPESQF